MKVFISWSGNRSHKVALVFREWLPSVIQDIVPYVSSEDIDKGARWSTDIAKELSDSTFGILCVTRDNMNAPWLMFEAGALSKTIEKAFVNPFLFDIKRSEIDGPILQFQSTISEKEDLKKLVATLNKSCGERGLNTERLNNTFEVWYPSLEKKLNELREAEPEAIDTTNLQETQTPRNQEILEEILELSRINQKLIRNPDGSLGSNLEEISQMVRMLMERIDRNNDPFSSRYIRKFHPMMFDEIMHMSLFSKDMLMGAQYTLSFFRHQIPWLYDVGVETINILRSKISIAKKRDALDHFKHLTDFAFETPMMREFYSGSKEWHYLSRRLPEMLIEVFEQCLKQ